MLEGTRDKLQRAYNVLVEDYMQAPRGSADEGRLMGELIGFEKAIGLLGWYLDTYGHVWARGKSEE